MACSRSVRLVGGIRQLRHARQEQPVDLGEVPLGGPLNGFAGILLRRHARDLLQLPHHEGRRAALWDLLWVAKISSHIEVVD